MPTHGGYRGASLNLAARLCALAQPGEILASETVIGLASRVDGMRFLEGRSATLKGMARPVRYVVVEPEQPLPPAPVSTGAGGRRRVSRRVLVLSGGIVPVAMVALAAGTFLGGSTSPAFVGEVVNPASWDAAQCRTCGVRLPSRTWAQSPGESPVAPLRAGSGRRRLTALAEPAWLGSVGASVDALGAASRVGFPSVFRGEPD